MNLKISGKNLDLLRYSKKTWTDSEAVSSLFKLRVVWKTGICWEGNKRFRSLWLKKNILQRFVVHDSLQIIAEGFLFVLQSCTIQGFFQVLLFNKDVTGLYNPNAVQ